VKERNRPEADEAPGGGSGVGSFYSRYAPCYRQRSLTTVGPPGKYATGRARGSRRKVSKVSTHRIWQQRLREERPREVWSAGGRRLIVEESVPDSVRFNAPAQGSAADGLKQVLALLWERRADCPSAVPILAAHDELVIKADRAQPECATEWLRAAMVEGMKPLLEPIPVAVEIAVSRSWGGATG
jgi:hypothetical protein